MGDITTVTEQTVRENSINHETTSDFLLAIDALGQGAEVHARKEEGYTRLSFVDTAKWGHSYNVADKEMKDMEEALKGYGIEIGVKPRPKQVQAETITTIVEAEKPETYTTRQNHNYHFFPCEGQSDTWQAVVASVVGNEAGKVTYHIDQENSALFVDANVGKAHHVAVCNAGDRTLADTLSHNPKEMKAPEVKLLYEALAQKVD